MAGCSLGVAAGERRNCRNSVANINGRFYVDFKRGEVS